MLATIEIPRYPELESRLPATAVLDIAEQIDTMRAVEEVLPAADLPHVAHFMLGYRTVTENVGRQLGKFDYPERTEITVGMFAQLAYRALRHHARGETDKICPAWQTVYYAPWAREAYPVVAMMAGWEVHIGRDLPEVLWHTAAQAHHKADYTREVNGILGTTAQQLRPIFFGDSLPARAAGWLGASWAMPYIRKLRESAWLTGQELLMLPDDAARQQLLESAGGRAGRLLLGDMRLGRLVNALT
jgi:hypothetical protein